MSIAQECLHQLEREPVSFLGLTFSEIKQCSIKSLGHGLYPAIIIALLIPTQYSALKFIIGLFLYIGLVYFIFRYTTSAIAKLRSDKPPFYDLHYAKRHNACFIRANKKWQRCRNHIPPKNITS